MLYLAYHDHPGELPPTVDGPWVELFGLQPGLVFVDSQQHRSAVYHGLEDQLPPGTALLVCELHEVPKFKGMAAGALTWARSRITA